MSRDDSAFTAPLATSSGIVPTGTPPNGDVTLALTKWTHFSDGGDAFRGVGQASSAFIQPIRLPPRRDCQPCSVVPRATSVLRLQSVTSSPFPHDSSLGDDPASCVKWSDPQADRECIILVS